MAVMVAAALGYWLLAPKMPSPIVTYTSQQTSLTSSSQTVVQSWTASSTLMSSTTLAETVQWINVSAAAVHPISYYLKLLESNGTEPYGQLARELRKLPDLTNATAVAKITHLALNATNPEVKEAFELMMKGGTPASSDFTYTVRNYNTELQVLYWLALQDQFKKDDTLALAIAMVNGLWVTMGDDQVREAVKKDTGDILSFFRETNELQKHRGYYQLEGYPLEAKIALAWTGNMNMKWVGLGSQPKMPMRLVYYANRRMPPVVYQKDTVSVATLKQMRPIALNMSWWVKDVPASVTNVETHFYSGTPWISPTKTWEYATPSAGVILDEDGLDAWLDIDWQFSRYLRGLRPRGDCGTEAAWTDAWAKSMGISTALHWMYKIDEPINSSSWYSHSYAIYFVPQTRTWTAWKRQILEFVPLNPSITIDYFIYRPPVEQRHYLHYQLQLEPTFMVVEHSAFAIESVNLQDTQAMLLAGIPTSQMKQWLLYS